MSVTPEEIIARSKTFSAVSKTWFDRLEPEHQEALLQVRRDYQAAAGELKARHIYKAVDEMMEITISEGRFSKWLAAEK